MVARRDAARSKERAGAQWARTGTRPRQLRALGYRSAYLFGAICPERGAGAAVVMPKANTEAMQYHIDEIARIVRPGAHAMLLLDGAAWHTAGALKWPHNITPLLLPPYAPELNPVETVIQFLRGNRWSNRVFDSVAAVKAACRDAWEWLRSSPDRIASLMRRDWACIPNVPA